MINPTTPILSNPEEYLRYRENERVNFCVIDPTVDNRWDNFVAGQEDGSIFHTAAWARTIREAYGYDPRYYVLEDNNGMLKAGMPLYQIKSALTGNRLVCLPFSDICLPLGEEADIGLLIERAKQDIEDGAASYLEIRGLPGSISPAQLGLESHDYHLLYVLDLETDTNAVQKRFHNSIRRGIRQAEKRGVVVRMTDDESDLKRFYKLHISTRKKLGVLPQPGSFFKALYRNVISKGLGFTGLAEADGRVIAGIVFLQYGDTVYYKFNASDERYLQKRPNHLVTWEGINYACAQKYRYFDFGRCSPDEEGLRTYKTRWGAGEIKLPYFYFPRVKGITSVAENSTRYKIMRLFSHLAPQCVFEAAGSLLYRHFG